MEAHDLFKEFPTPAGALQILKGVSLDLEPGDAVSIMGPSGGGKSTLLFLLGALDTPTSGSIELDGRNPFELSEPELAEFRNAEVGFVFQDHCLLPQCTVLENVLAPTLVAPKGDYHKRAGELVDHVGLSERSTHRPGELSGGEKQRVAIARALIREPQLLLCDEPTGNLDGDNAQTVTKLLLDLQEREKRILVVVTHSPELADRFPKRMELKNGTLRER